MVNAPSVLYIAPAMTRLPPSVTVTKASTGLSKTPPPWLVQVSRVLFKNWTFSDSGDILSFCLHVFNLFQSAVPYFPHPSALFFISNMIQLKLNLCLHNFIPPYLKFETKKKHVLMYLIHVRENFWQLYSWNWLEWSTCECLPPTDTPSTSNLTSLCQIRCTVAKSIEIVFFQKIWKLRYRLEWNTADDVESQAPTHLPTYLHTFWWSCAH